MFILTFGDREKKTHSRSLRVGDAAGSQTLDRHHLLLAVYHRAAARAAAGNSHGPRGRRQRGIFLRFSGFSRWAWLLRGSGGLLTGAAFPEAAGGGALRSGVAPAGSEGRAAGERSSVAEQCLGGCG
jgi:hypothetical protein